METTPNADETNPESASQSAEESAAALPPLADGAAEIALEVMAEVRQEEATQATPHDNVENAAPDASAPAAATPELVSSEAPASEPTETASAPVPAEDELGQLAARAQTARLSMPDEDRAKALLKAALLDGKPAVARAASLLPRFAWVVGVDAVTTAWPDMKATSRTQLLKALGDEDSDQVRRMRLSLARGLFKIDLPAALKVAVGAARDLRDKETGALSNKHAQIFSNVFIGKAKPWVSQLPLADVKPADADILVQCAVSAAFGLPHPPVTQLGVLKWAAEAARLAKVPASSVEIITKAVSRWSAKWQGVLRKEVAELPEEIAAALRPETTSDAPGEQPQTSGEAGDSPDSNTAPAAGIEDEPAAGEENATGDAPPAEPRRERPVYEPRPQKPQPAAEATRDREPRDRDSRKERPVYQPRNGGTAAQGFNLSETLRQIEAHVQSLRSELNTAQTKLRQREEDPRRSRRGSERSAAPIVEGEPTNEELARLNQQLEARNAELQVRIDELLADSEDRAVSTGAMAGEPVEDTSHQLRTLLALKLQEDYEDFLALEQEAPDFVVQQHYKSLLKDVFKVLLSEGVALKQQAES